MERLSRRLSEKLVRTSFSSLRLHLISRVRCPEVEEAQLVSVEVLCVLRSMRHRRREPASCSTRARYHGAGVGVPPESLNHSTRLTFTINVTRHSQDLMLPHLPNSEDELLTLSERTPTFRTRLL